MLVNPETAVGRALRRRYLAAQAFQTMAATVTSQLQSLLVPICRAVSSCTEIAETLRQVTAVLRLEPASHGGIDPRIQEALVIARQRSDNKISAQELAAAIALSPSRMSHLFKEDVGIPLRRYLLWQRLLAGLSYAGEGKSLTNAAHAVGFTDLAHFSHTCSRMFGIWPSVLFDGKGGQGVYILRCELPD